MGFDAGLSFGAIALALLYASVFLPAFAVTLLPARLIFEPPRLLRIWYRSIGALLVSIPLLGGVWKIVEVVHSGGGSQVKTGEVCVQLIDADPTRVWIDISFNGQPFERFRTHFNGRKGACIRLGPSSSPFQVLARSAPPQSNGQSNATDDLALSQPLMVPFLEGQTQCVSVSRDLSISPHRWVAALAKCVR